MAPLHKIPSAGALVLAAPASDDERLFRLATPVDTDALDLQLIVMHGVFTAPGAMTVPGPTVAHSSQVETKTGLYRHLRLAQGDTGTVTVRLAPAQADRFIMVRRRRLAASGSGMSSIRFPRCPAPPAQAAPPDASRLFDLYASDPGNAFGLLTRLSPSGRRDAALALLARLAENDAEAGPYDPLLMLLQVR